MAAGSVPSWELRALGGGDGARRGLGAAGEGDAGEDDPGEEEQDAELADAGDRDGSSEEREQGDADRAPAQPTMLRSERGGSCSSCSR